MTTGTCYEYPQKVVRASRPDTVAFAEYIQQLCDHEKWRLVRFIVDDCSPDISGVDPDCLYEESLGRARVGQIEEAIHGLNSAKYSYIAKNMSARAVECCLELAYLYQRKENFQLAFEYITEAESLLQGISDTSLQADLLFRLAELCPDIGRLQESQGYAKQALERFQRDNNLSEQFSALMLLAIVSNQLGNFHEADARFEMAKQCYVAGCLGSGSYVFLLNTEAHLQWYRGNFPQAIEHAQQLKDVADANNMGKQRTYARILLGNLYRAQGDYQVAEEWYADTRRMTIELDFNDYLPWVDFQTAWLTLLVGNLDEAYRLILKALEPSDYGQRMSFAVGRAILHILKEQFPAAETLLLDSLEFYENSGDVLSVHAIQVYLAWICVKTDRIQAATSYLNHALAWFAEKNIDYFPNWWHPQLISHVCGYALIENVYTPIVEQIFINRLGDPGIQVLRNLRHHDDVSVRKRAHELRKLLGDEEDALGFVEDGPAKHVLEEHLEMGFLKREHFDRLKKRLITAAHRKSYNPVIIAVFSLYLQGKTGEGIAERLQVSHSLVKKYINTIYEMFDVPKQGGTRARKNELRQKAQEEGFI